MEMTNYMDCIAWIAGWLVIVELFEVLFSLSFVSST
jgi:hypothetical protein